MIDENALRSLLGTAGDFTAPEDGPARVLAGITPPDAARTRRTRLTWPRLAVVVVVAVVALSGALVGLGRDNSSDELATTGAKSLADGQPVIAPSAGGAGGVPAGPSPGALSAATGSAGAPADGVATPPPSAAAPELTRIIKTGAIEIEVGKGRVDDAVARLATLAAGAGGYVSDTKTSSSDGRRSAAVTVRVPADRFERVVDQVARSGRVRSTDVSGRDVTAEYTDVQARLRVLTTSRDSLLQVLSKARAIGDILAVQDRLNGVQTEIEQLQGRQRVLDDQVALATLAVSVTEPGAPSSLTRSTSAWSRAIDGFTGTWADVLAASGTALAIVLLALVVIAAGVGLVRWGRRVLARAVA